MNCQRFEDVVGDLACDQIMEADVRVAALSHSDHCSSCNQRLRDEQALTRGLDLLSQKIASISAPADIEMRLREAMRERRVSQPVVAGKLRSAYRLAIAAAILLIFGTLFAVTWQWQLRGRKEVAERPAVIPEPQKNETADEPQNIAFNDDTPKPVQPRKPRPRSTFATRQSRKGSDAVANHASEIATDFIPLGNINSASLEDGGHIVRVELPRSALVKFGLPVNMDRFNEKVKADVWLGVDGLAHAIRFVQ